MSFMNHSIFNNYMHVKHHTFKKNIDSEVEFLVLST